MNGLRAAAAEAEAILKRARWSTQLFDINNDVDSNDGSLDQNLGWDNDQPYYSTASRKRTADQFTSNSFSPGRRDMSSQSSSPVKKKTKFNIHEKLRELYEEFSSDETLQQNYQGLKVSSYLLEKLLSRINLNVLIINLYPGNKGYSISLKVNGDTQMLSPPIDGTTNIGFRSEETLLETARWPYEEEDLLSYIDNEELPIVLLDLLETEYSCLFYSGCIIAQIRDYRQTYPSPVCDTHHVLLKPTTQSIINDVNSIVRSGSWGREERLFLESAVVLATAPPLCLEPRPAVGLLAARLHHQRHLLATPDIRRQARRYSQVSINRKRRLDQLTQYRGLGLLELINKQRAKAAVPVRHTSATTPLPRASSKYPKKPSEVLRAVLAPRVESPPLVAPADVSNIVARLARAYDRPRASSDYSPQLMEEYVLETERTLAPSASTTTTVPPGVFHIKLSILQRPSNQEFLGELYVDRDHVEGERNGSACRFLLGTRTHANRYIQQFTEIFTEEGRKSVRIKHLVPGQLPRVSYTAGMRELTNAHLARVQSLTTASAATPSSIASGNSTSGQGNTGGLISQHSLVNAIKVPPPSPAVPSPTGVVSAPAPSPEVVLVTGPSATARRAMSANLPLLQAQLQAGPQTVQQIQGNQHIGNSTQVSQLEQAVAGLKQSQTLNSIQHIQLNAPSLKPTNTDQLQTVQLTSQQTSQLQQLQNAQQTSNQLLTQQLTNPPQPINPHKLQPAIIHIQHPLSSQLLQQKVVTCQTQIQGSQHVTLQTQPGITLQGQPNISIQGQQGITLQGQQGITIQGQSNLNLTPQQANAVSTSVAQMQKVTPPKQRTTNPAISALVTSLMNSAHQFQQQAAASAAAKSSSNMNNVSNNSGNNATILNLLNSAPAAMTNTVGGTPTLVETVSKKAAPTSALLERLMAPPAPSAPNLSPQPLGMVPQVQNVQVQIPGIPQPISLSLNVSAAGGGSTGLLVSVPVSQPTPPSTQNVISLPITHLMAGGVKAGTPLQLVRPRVAPRQMPAKLPNANIPTGPVQYINQQQAATLGHQQRRRSNPNEPNK